ncbi:hypothetical protein N7G274_002768 [Stereocaulon virgatum]|uniref:Helicase C-terminal domain-containing protein n=1 Tax=Stereocaulon virgatum TaxID=373712 RepID=A0ABR4ANG8_9LECA
MRLTSSSLLTIFENRRPLLANDKYLYSTPSSYAVIPDRTTVVPESFCTLQSSAVPSPVRFSRTLLRPSCAQSGHCIYRVVFSCWTKMLDLIGQGLSAAKIRYERLDGKMTTPQRHTAIQSFRNDPNCTVFLATIGSAGVGIDLTAACRVHLMEPQWNPMAEEQALDRVHRIGQTQPVTATRYIVSESVEEYVVSLQKTKLDLIQQSLGPSMSRKAGTLREKLQIRFSES